LLCVPVQLGLKYKFQDKNVLDIRSFQFSVKREKLTIFYYFSQLN